MGRLALVPKMWKAENGLRVPREVGTYRIEMIMALVHREARLAAGHHRPSLITVEGPVNRFSCLNGSLGCEAMWSCHPPECHRQCDERLAWKRDVALEISVDVEHDPVTIWLSGMLDRDTAINLPALIAELIEDGHRAFELKTSGLCVPDKGGIEALNRLQRIVQESGGYLTWDGLTTNHPFPATEGHSRRADSVWRSELVEFDNHRHQVQRVPPKTSI